MTKKKQKLHPSDRVLAWWYQDEFWYPATVRKVGDVNQIYVQFDDGDKQWTAREDILVMDIEPGDRVHVKTQGGEYYPAHILDIKKDTGMDAQVQVQFEAAGEQETTTIKMMRVTR